MSSMVSGGHSANLPSVAARQMLVWQKYSAVQQESANNTSLGLTMMSSTKLPLVLPIITIQPDLQTVISEVYEELIPSKPIWVLCYKSGEESFHANIKVILDEVDRNKVFFRKGDGGMEVNKDRESTP